MIDSMLAASAAQRERRILLSVPGLPIDLTCVTLDKRTVERCQQSAERLYGRKPGLWNWHLCASLIGNATQEIEFNGVRLEDEDGDPITFGMCARFGVTEMVEAVGKTLGRDGNVVALGRALLDESGYDREGNPVVEEADPS